MDLIRAGGENHLRRGLWSPDEDELLLQCIAEGGITRWSDVPIRAGLRRSGKSCRLRWINYLRPEVNHNRFSAEEDKLIIEMHRIIGNRWSKMAARLRGRTDNQIKNHWNSTIKKQFRALGIDPAHRPSYPVVEKVKQQQNAVESETAAKASEADHSGSRILPILASNNPQLHSHDIMAQGASSVFTMQQNSAHNFSWSLPAEGLLGDCVFPCIDPGQAELHHTRFQAPQWMPMMADLLMNPTHTPSNFTGSEPCGLLLEQTAFWED